MIKHLQYLCYLLKHKWYVFLACAKRGEIWRGIVHDWTKFLPSEWFPYVDYFYAKTGWRTEAAFNRAWLLHQHRNPHHWQHWILRNDGGSSLLIEMPKEYVIEMVSDWDGAGKAISGKVDTQKWYRKNKYQMQLHPNTRVLVEELILGIKK